MFRRTWLSWCLGAVIVLVGVDRMFGAEPANAIAFKQLRVGRAVVSLPAHWTTLGPEIPVWLHLHGAPATVDSNFAAAGAPGVLVNITLPGLSRVYTEHFAEPRGFADLLRDVEAALRAESSAQSWRLGALTVSSFSAGFGGVRELLKQPNAFARIGTLVMADSIYCGYTGDPAERRIDPGLMSGFVRFAEEAAEGRKRLLITHSRQQPEGYASTTETADYLIAKLEGARTFEAVSWVGGLLQASSFAQGQFEVLGFEGGSPDDHLRHLRGISGFLERVQPAGATPAAATLAELRAQLAAHVTHARFNGAAWGVKVASLESGRVLYEHHADRLLSPASNSKLYAAAAVLDHFGGDYRIITPIFGTAKPDTSGALDGDLIVSGRGDPSWSARRTKADFWTTFEPFVSALERAGVKRITGQIVGDATYFHGPPNGAGWTADDLEEYYGAEISALTLEDNYAELRIAPAAKPGEPCVVTMLLPHTGLVLDNRATTGTASARRGIVTRRIFGENVLRVFGEIPIGGAPITADVTVPRPANWFATALKAALERRGIQVDGGKQSIRWPEPSAVTNASVKLGEVVSPPLRELIANLMKPSQNLETDLIFAHLGEALRAPDAPVWRTSEQSAVIALREFLQKNRLPLEEVRFEEGSGLSRNNLTTANATVALLQFMAAHREAAAFFESLPVAGVDGTLRRRMKGTPGEGSVRAKTGSLRWANALSGYVTSAAGEKLVFSAMLNRAVLPAGRNARDELDAIALMLVRYSGKVEANAPVSATPPR